MVHSLASVFLESYWSALAGQQSVVVQFSQYVRFLISPWGVFSFFVSQAYIFCPTLFSLRASEFYSCRVSAWICVTSMLLFQLGKFFEVRVIISCCIFMYEVLFGLCFRCWFYQYPQVFVPNKCVLWLQSRSCFMAIFCLLTLSRVFITWGLILLNFYYPLVLFTICFVASSRKCFTANCLLPDSVETVSEPGA